MKALIFLILFLAVYAAMVAMTATEKSSAIAIAKRHAIPVAIIVIGWFVILTFSVSNGSPRIF